MKATSDTEVRCGSGSSDGDTGAWIVYDGDCPFCSAYTRYVRLREAVGPVRLINARDGGPVVDDVVRAGYDLNDGMVLKLGGRYYHGSDCVHVLATLSGGSNAFNRLNGWIFESPTRARYVYPVLRAGRNAVLRLLGRTKLEARSAGGPTDQA